MRRAVEQVEADRVADGPVVEVAAPAVHLRGRDARRLVDERRQHAGLVPAGVPERGGELVIPPEALGQLLQVAHRYAKRLSDGMPYRAMPSRMALPLLRFSQSSASWTASSTGSLRWVAEVASVGPPLLSFRDGLDMSSRVDDGNLEDPTLI